ncbi:MurR/RpiR family transcriptional regulator [Virgibacillus halodenitrificans]|uniref:MurR/RpiR family transcriptional regulator n=1 Tax=Virgibacillus halodenitrificans TaxID=1482 RepID=UPI001F3701C4|nr:MurR/RpiR family transcriptional regulator [Virgibacillus halodenitrificans]MCG1027249.1 MurR/RpiR family transcriptional regulator [Virgibacillus halodenitrificans]
MQNTLEKMKQGIFSMSPSEKKVAEYILKNTSAILDMPISKLAKKTSASEATIIRMCRSLEFKGYKELKLGLSAAISSIQEENKQQIYPDIAANASLGDIIDFVSYNNLQSIKSTISLIKEDIMKEAIQLLDKSRRIAVVGVGASAIVALDFEQKCKRINKWCDALTDSHTQLTTVVHLTSEDVVLAISYSGETKEIVDTSQIAKKNNVPIISITRYGNSKVQGLSDLNLYASPTEKSIRSGATASRIAQLSIVDILFTGIASKNFEEAVDLLNKTRRVIQNRI